MPGLKIERRNRTEQETADYQAREQNPLAGGRSRQSDPQLADRRSDGSDKDAIGCQERVSTFVAGEIRQPIIDRPDALGYSNLPIDAKAATTHDRFTFRQITTLVRQGP